ncbi:MAG: molybdopterin cofactor-binding domain-containing protein, partial [Bacteroidota bacterium]
NAFIRIDPSGAITLMSHKAEMGQGAFQVVPQIIAEELEVSLDQVTILSAPSDPKYGSMGTGGSATVRGTYRQLLKLGATAREMLIEAAASQWGASRSDCQALEGTVIHKPSGKKLTYGQLASAASKVQPPAQVKLKNRSEYKVIGKPIKRVDTPLKTNGAAIFGIDKKLPGMLYAVVERNPRFLGKVKSFDATEAMKVKGVKKVFAVKMNVFTTKREGVAVVADSTWAALQGRKALKVEWDDTGFVHHNTESLFKGLKDSLSSPGLNQRTAGNGAAALAKAEKTIEAIYETPYESHSCMEPLNCVAHFQGTRCEVWGPIQSADWVQGDIAGNYGLDLKNVVVNMTFLGGGLGRKAFLDYPHEAVEISKAIGGPVQVVWTREDDMTQGPFRPGAAYKCTAGLRSGRIHALEIKMAAQNMDHRWPNAYKTSYNASTTEGFTEAYYEGIPHYSFSDVPMEAPIPIMWWRSVYASTNGFAYESFMDEVALATGKDPIEFRKSMSGRERFHELVDRLVAVSGWNSRKKGEGYGVAITECFGSTVGEVVKVSRDAQGKVKIDKVWAVMDCGWYVNPDVIRQQVEGSVIMAIGAATLHETHFNEGKAVERNFDAYKMPRLQHTPVIEVHIMENEERAGGVGEPGLPPLAPALANAVYDLTGQRIRKLPFSLETL